MKADPLFHAVLLLLGVGVLAAACLLDVRGTQQVVLPWVDVPLPEVCTYKRLVGGECPGCGLTRCFIRMTRGDLAGAWAFNPAGILLFGLVLLQLPYRTAQLWRIWRGLPEIRLRRLPNLLLWLLVAALLGQWILRVVTAWPDWWTVPAFLQL